MPPPLQAYRLEPLINPIYAQVKPVKIDSAGSKTTKEAVDHAEGPRPESAAAMVTAKTSSWFSSLWSGTASSKKAESSKLESTSSKYPDKVRR